MVVKLKMMGKEQMLCKIEADEVRIKKLIYINLNPF